MPYCVICGTQISRPKITCGAACGKKKSRILQVVRFKIMMYGTWLEEEIYELCDPRDGQPHYVGRSLNVLERLYNHKQSPYKGKMESWIKELTDCGLSPTLKVVCRVPAKVAGVAEEQQIYRRLQEGCDLYNITSRKWS